MKGLGNLTQIISKEDMELDTIHSHCKRGNLEKVVNMLRDLKKKKKQKAINDQNNNNQQTPLHISIMNHHLTLAKALIKLGCNVNLRDVIKRTPLLYCARYGLLELFDFLIENGADNEVEDGYGENCIHLAVASSNLQFIEHLLKKKIGNIGRQNYNEETPLHKAARRFRECEV
eukprot:TRINITY_DN7561_c0_g2_i1.p1 TRINITY_DN7561_c0_g2~~TRINITY_DN7561_c0_g2_i1.p1  ORF type:complete len:174 (-),score=29.29 TRINITY_DN7561_c0_g2_i1:82-603(-)